MRLFKRFMTFLLIAAFTAGLVLAADLTKEEQAWLAKAVRQETNGWVFLHIEGKPFVRGFQHGYLLAKEIAESLRVAKHITWWDTAREWPFFVEQTLRMFAPKIEPEYREEMEGITAGARKAGIEVSYGDIVLLNASSEIMGYWYPWFQKENGPSPKSGGAYLHR